jgi:hypothetical protein
LSQTDSEKLIFELSDRLRVMPIMHGSADFALAVRDELLRERHDCFAVPLPPSFADDVLAAVKKLPLISAVIQSCGDDEDRFSYVPIDPCQGVIRGLRSALAERIKCAFIDIECQNFIEEDALFPDPYALKQMSPEKFAIAVMAATPPPEPGSQQDQRVRHMAFELHKLELENEKILCVCSILDWPWLVDAYRERREYPESNSYFAPIETHPVDSNTLAFFLAELPYITGLYEDLRSGFEEEATLSIDGIKELLLEARDRTVEKRPKAKSRLTTKRFATYLQYVRNLTLIRRRLRPDLITLIEAAKQVFGDDYAIRLLETARDYPHQEIGDDVPLRMGPSMADIPFHGQFQMVNRLPGQEVTWRSLELKKEPEPEERERWEQVWDPHKQCSWPPEDSRIESFNSHVRQQAREMLNQDLARVEEFSSSMKDGLDMRETLRNWHTGKLYVREYPPAQGSIEIVVFLFDVPADPNKYTWRTTWFAEHEEESTLVFFATDYHDNMLGPGVAQSRYGGAFFLFPPRPIPDIWHDPALDEWNTLEERLLAGAFMHSTERHVCIVSPCPLKASWRRLARRFGKVPLHLPLGRFSQSTVDRLRDFHVLNGQEVRSYAAKFIRDLD